MTTTLIRNAGAIVSGDVEQPRCAADSLLIVDGLITEVGTAVTDADVVVDANGLVVTPGLVDGHTHPVFGDFSPVQNSVGWMQAYLQCGTTTIVSAGELHLPGLPLGGSEPVLYRYLAILARRCFATYRPGGLKVEAGTMLLTPGMHEDDFDELRAAGCRVVKFIFFPYAERMDEALQYRAWAARRGLVVKVHSGGVSRSGVSQPAGRDVITKLQPDVIAHATGGPIPMPFEELRDVVDGTSGYLEVTYAGNPRWARDLVPILRDRGALGRISLGSDTPSGTGITPRAMLRLVALLVSLGEITAEEGLCLGSGNTARAHQLDTGYIRVGAPADLAIIGRVAGANGTDALEALGNGDLPGVSMVFVDGIPVVRERSTQTPPPERAARIIRSVGEAHQ